MKRAHSFSTLEPFISVVLVVKNGAAFLEESLASVVGQTVPPREVIVVDDNSTDGTREIAQSFAGRGVRYLNNVAELGIAGSRNRGVAEACGDFIAFSSHDDIWFPEKLALQTAAFERDPALQICLTHLRCFLDPGETSLPAAFPAHLLHCDVPGWVMETLMVRRAVFECVGLFDGSFGKVDDTEWYARAQNSSAKISILPQTLVRKRIHGRSITYGASPAKRATLEIARRSIAAKRGQEPRRDDGGAPRSTSR